MTRNLFVLAQSRLGGEDQLTELLAYLLERDPVVAVRWLSEFGIDFTAGELVVETQVHVPNVGRLDLVLTQPGTRCVVVESKLGSDFGLGDEQLGRYARYLVEKRSEPLRALVALTRGHTRSILQS